MKPITIITGPQGSGKTTKALELAKQFKEDEVLILDTDFDDFDFFDERIEKTKLIIFENFPPAFDIVMPLIAYVYLQQIPYAIFTTHEFGEKLKKFKSIEFIKCNYHGKG